ncbi:MAG: hypothetical protein KKG75_00600 [Nanoarchaeota archaeon]|nr:hypothetical protein [Nanoarchaeota archaeon]
MGDVSLNYTVTLILTLIAILTLGGCVYKIYYPNCDPQAVDKFNEFTTLFESCLNGNCGEFNFQDIPEGHKIVLKSSGTITDIRLNCGGRFSSKLNQAYNVGLCTYRFGKDSSENIGEFDISYSLIDSLYSFNGNIKIRKTENKICMDKKEVEYRSVIPTLR